MSKKLRIIFIGTPEFAVESLKAVYESGRNVLAVITAPDKKAGRGQKIKFSAVKQYALEKNLPVLQPSNLKSESFLNELAAFNADIQLVVAFRMLPEAVWNMPRLGTFNLHASLLPKYRGAAPINWAIINGEKETGLTTFFLKQEIDTGDVLLQKTIQLKPNETAGSLHDTLMVEGAQLVLESFELIESGAYQLKQQAQLSLSKNTPLAPKIFKEHCRIDWEKTALEIERLVRGMSPYPTAWTKITQVESGKTLQLKVFELNILDEVSQSPGKIELKAGRLTIGTSDYFLELKELQLEGKKRMSAKALINGFDIQNYRIAPFES